MRLFIALDPDKSAVAALVALQRKMQALKIEGTYVAASSFHITLRFLGETDRLGDAALAMREGVRGVRPFSLSLSSVGTFGSGDRKTSVVRVAGDLDELKCLYESTEAALSNSGFVRETRPLAPHVTLCRRTTPHAEHLDELQHALVRHSFNIDHVMLYESVRMKDGRVFYRAMSRADI